MSCQHWDWEEGEGACRERVGEGERGKERREERGERRRREEREGGRGGIERERGEREAAISSLNRTQRCRSQCSELRAECR